MIPYKTVDKDRFLASWISYKNLPLNFFDDDFTQRFFKYVKENDVELPLRNKMTEILDGEFDKMEENLKVLLASIDSKVSFCWDGWTSPAGDSFYGLTGHFIKDSWVLISIALDLIAASGKIIK